MELRNLYTAGRSPAVSFELFPPKTPQGEEALYGHVERLLAFHPSYVTCTYGAGGSTQNRTLEIVAEVKSRWNIPVASHLTCVAATVEALRSYLREAESRGIDYIVALRGDPPRGESEFRVVEGGLAHANELVALIRNEFPQFGVAVAGYPEKHVEAESFESDLDYLRQKVDAGADIVITQLFYDNTDFLRFRDRCESAGISVPIIPGILPITGFAQIERITALCGAKLPADLVTRLGNAVDPQVEQRIGLEHAVLQVEQLLESGALGLHFYVLNKSEATSEVLTSVGWLNDFRTDGKS